jgi:catechol 2,3-dioxygenase-like lactoylglutathione lyase family enzyme
MTIHHIGLWVRDLTRSGCFYNQILGFEKRYDYQTPAELMKTVFGRAVNCQVEVLQRDGIRLELFQPDVPVSTALPEPLPAAINHFGLKVDDKASFCRKAREKGADVIEVRRQDHSTFFLRDPDGLLIEIKDE